MKKRNIFLTALIVTSGLCCGSLVVAQGKDVDQADTLDFQSFHKDKKEAVKVWKEDASKTATTVKTYDQNATSTTTPVSTAVDAAKSTTVDAAKPVATTATTSAAPASDTQTKAGQRFEIRERYTLTRSTKTPYSAFYVIEPLYKQAAQLCSKGWKKLTERSEPIEQDFYLYYEIECL